jgi:predicted aminopeptidase
VDINSIPARLGAALMGLGLILPLAGCYELQAIAGQVSLLSKRRPIPSVIADPATPQKLRTQLQAVARIRDFASRELKLPDNGSYRGYADIGRSNVVWNVFAAPEFSMMPRRWCYPVIGCVAYRGYFAERKARKFARSLQAQGDDVAVKGATAYSTLGHFDDPVLNTMVLWSDVDLAAIIFHELTHQLLYVRDDASFNEALATLIEEEGVRRWLLAQGRERDLAAFIDSQARYALVIGILLDTRQELEKLYGSGEDQVTMRVKKAALFDELRQRYQQLKASWASATGYDAWFDATLNNADLVSIATYQACLPGLKRELASLNGDLPGFFRRAGELAKMPAAQREALVCRDAAQSEGIANRGNGSGMSARK